MASCSFLSFIEDPTSCGQSLYYTATATCVSLTECQKDISQYLNNMNVFADEKTESEIKLILGRAG